MSRTVNSRASVPAVMARLDQASWGNLADRTWHGLRATLRGVAAIVDYRTGVAFATVDQVADASGYKNRWTRHCLAELEALGAIEWERGGITSAGKTAPSWFRISKEWMLTLAREGRVSLTAIRAERAKRTAARIAGLSFVKPGRYKPRSHHAAVSATLSTPSVEIEPPTTEKSSFIPPTEVGECEHGFEKKRHPVTAEPQCPICRHHERSLLGKDKSARDVVVAA